MFIGCVGHYNGWNNLYSNTEVRREYPLGIEQSYTGNSIGKYLGEISILA